MTSIDHDFSRIFESFVSKGYFFYKLNDLAEINDSNSQCESFREQSDSVSSALFELNEKMKELNEKLEKKITGWTQIIRSLSEKVCHGEQMKGCIVETRSAMEIDINNSKSRVKKLKGLTVMYRIWLTMSSWSRWINNRSRWC